MRYDDQQQGGGSPVRGRRGAGYGGYGGGADRSRYGAGFHSEPPRRGGRGRSDRQTRGGANRGSSGRDAGPRAYDFGYGVNSGYSRFSDWGPYGGYRGSWNLRPMVAGYDRDLRDLKRRR